MLLVYFLQSFCLFCFAFLSLDLGKIDGLGEIPLEDSSAKADAENQQDARDSSNESAKGVSSHKYGGDKIVSGSADDSGEGVNALS